MRDTRINRRQFFKRLSGPAAAAIGLPYFVPAASLGKGGAIARFAEVSGREAAQALRGTALSVARETLPALEEGEYYHADLVGLAVVTVAGDAVGRVIAVQNYGASDIVEIEKPDGKAFMVPMIEQAVLEWDGERLVISADFAE